MTPKKRFFFQPYGQGHHSAKLTDREVDKLRQFRREGWTYAALARVFEISKSQVRNIVKERQRL